MHGLHFTKASKEYATNALQRHEWLFIMNIYTIKKNYESFVEHSRLM